MPWRRERPAHLTGASEAYSNDDLVWVAARFDIPTPLSVEEFALKGNINLHTYEVIADGRSYLLQKVNAGVFTMPYRVMRGMTASIRAQRESLSAGVGPEDWEPIELIPTRDGKEFLDLTDEHGWSVWRMMVRIPDSKCYRSLSELRTREERLRIAEEVGRGMAVYTDLTSSVDTKHVEGSLPGYRDTALYYRIFHSIREGNRTFADAAQLLPHDPVLRSSTEKHFLVKIRESEHEARLEDPELKPYIELAMEQEPFALVLWNALSQGRIRRTTIHGDPKIENFLFSATTGRVKSLVDLDTITAFTWLADWGDMIRSLVNVAGERERDLSKVDVDTDVYEAVARGFLGSVKAITAAERALMVQAAQVLTLEQGIRFLTDYIRGDTYYRLSPNDPADLNKVRAMVQFTLYRGLMEFGPAAEEHLAQLG